jgi:hypothetical protein
MELCKGSTLLDEVLDLGSYSADTARLIFTQVRHTATPGGDGYAPHAQPVPRQCDAGAVR